jgi:nuclear pore complex protein Nup155
MASSRSFSLSQSQYNPAPLPRFTQQKPIPVDLPSLQNASRILYDQFTKDAQIIPDLGETLTACTSKLIIWYMHLRICSGRSSLSFI